MDATLTNSSSERTPLLIRQTHRQSANNGINQMQGGALQVLKVAQISATDGPHLLHGGAAVREGRLHLRRSHCSLRYDMQASRSAHLELHVAILLAHRIRHQLFDIRDDVGPGK
jgi:hypothetical protein